MGMFQYAVALASADGTREEEVRPGVDTGAMYCQFPENMLTALGYKPTSQRRFTPADGTIASRPFGAVNMRIGDDVQPVHCVYDTSNQAMMLLGAIALEAFSLAADPVDKVLEPTIGMMLTMLTDEDPRL